MSVSGLCEICERPGVEHNCDRCGQLVCNRHFDEQVGACADCIAEIQGPTDDDRRETDQRPDGVDIYRF